MISNKFLIIFAGMCFFAAYIVWGIYLYIKNTKAEKEQNNLVNDMQEDGLNN